MKKKNQLKMVVYFFAALVAIASVLAFWVSSTRGNTIFEEVGEATGTMLAVAMGFEMILFFPTQALKRKMVPQIIKEIVVTLTKYLREYHSCTGALALSVLFFHMSITLDLKNLWADDIFTGLITTLFIGLSVLAGLFYKPKRKAAKTFHMIFAFALWLPFLLHIE